MSDKAGTLAYSAYFLNCLWPHLTKAREANIAEVDLAASFIEDTSAGNTSV